VNQPCRVRNLQYEAAAGLKFTQIAFVARREVHGNISLGHSHLEGAIFLRGYYYGCATAQ
jgi:hypothetical protein